VYKIWGENSKKRGTLGDEVKNVRIILKLLFSDHNVRAWTTFNNNNNNNIYLLQLGCHPVAVVILHVYKT
jgi:hypothetical protein